MASSKYFCFFQNRLNKAVLSLFLLSPSVTYSRTILSELTILRSIALTLPHTDHTHRFGVGPFGRFTSSRTGHNTVKDLAFGSAMIYRYMHSERCSLDTITAVESEEANYNNEGDRFSRSRFGIDDISFLFNFEVVRKNKSFFSVSGVIDLPTAAPNPLGNLAGSGHYQYGGFFSTRIDLPGELAKALDLSIIGNGLLLTSAKRTVLLNKNMQVIPSGSPERPFFKETFDVGDGFFNILALRSGPDEQGMEVGYHGSIIFNVHDKITPLTSVTSPSMTSRIKRHKEMERLTIHKNGTKATFLHHFYVLFNYTACTDPYPVGIACGGSYAFGTTSLREFTGWLAMSIHF
jgi:hypothetical protein